jgi:hypothetical protein
MPDGGSADAITMNELLDGDDEQTAGTGARVPDPPRFHPPAIRPAGNRARSIHRTTERVAAASSPTAAGSDGPESGRPNDG